MNEINCGICIFGATISKLLFKYYTFNITLLCITCMSFIPNISHLINLASIKQVSAQLKKCESTDLSLGCLSNVKLL